MVGLICVNKLFGRAVADPGHDDDQFRETAVTESIAIPPLAVRAQTISARAIIDT